MSSELAWAAHDDGGDDDSVPKQPMYDLITTTVVPFVRCVRNSVASGGRGANRR